MNSEHVDPAANVASQLGPEAMAGVHLKLEGRSLQVFFIHSYLAAYWIKEHGDELETAARNCLGRDLEFTYNSGGMPQLSACSRPSRPDGDDYFSEFIPRSENASALSAARLLCDPSSNLRALFITGQGGAGKSLLLNIIARELARKLGRNSVYLTSAEIFQDDFRIAKAILVDNLQLLQTGGQRLLAAILETAADKGQRIALAGSDNSIIYENISEPRLRRRLESLLHFDLAPPDLVVRLQWVEKQNKIRQLGLGHDQIAMLCRQERHISRLEGLLQKFAFYSKIENRTWAWEELEKMAPPEQAQPWLRIFALVARRLGVAETDIAGSSRQRDIVFARQVAMCLARRTLGLSYPELGRIFGNRDHATVIHSIRKIEKLQQVDKDLHNLLTELSASLF